MEKEHPLKKFERTGDRARPTNDPDKFVWEADDLQPVDNPQQQKESD